MAFITFLKRRPKICLECRFADKKSLDEKDFMACCVDKPETAFDGKNFISGRPFAYKDAPACRLAKK